MRSEYPILLALLVAAPGSKPLLVSSNDRHRQKDSRQLHDPGIEDYYVDSSRRRIGNPEARTPRPEIQHSKHVTDNAENGPSDEHLATPNERTFTLIAFPPYLGLRCPLCHLRRSVIWTRRFAPSPSSPPVRRTERTPDPEPPPAGPAA